MAQTTRNSFKEEKNFKGVLHQATRPVTDADLNEGQDIAALDLASSVRSVVGASDAIVRTGDPAKFSLAYIDNDGDWAMEVLPGGAIQFGTGPLYVNGYRFLSSEIFNTSGSLSLTMSAFNAYGFIYADVYLDEVDSTEDPDIAYPFIGETGLRRKLRLDFGKVSSATSFEAAFNALVALPAAPVANGSVQTGYKARVLVGRFYYPADADPSDASEAPALVPLLQRLKQDTDLLVSTPEALVWTGAYLTVGSFSGDDETTMISVALGGSEAIQYAGRSVTAPPAANAAPGRIPTTPSTAQAWAIPAGYALGWLAEGTSTNRSSQLLHLPLAPLQPVFFDSEVTDVAYKMRVAKLVVAPLADFSSQPGTRILCYHNPSSTGISDLIFPSSGLVLPAPPTGRAVAGRIGVEPNEWNAVVSSASGGSAHFFGARSLERVLELLWYSSASSNYVDDFSVLAKAGTYTFGATARTIGPAPTVTTSRLRIKGAGANKTTLTAYTTIHTTEGYLVLSADTIVIEDVRLSEAIYSGVAKSYGWTLTGRKVILRNCIIDCPVKIKADIIEVVGCEGKFYDQLGNRTEHVQGRLGASCLHLAVGAGLGTSWVVTDCFFQQQTTSITDRFPVLLLDVTGASALKPFTVDVRNTNFDFKPPVAELADAPAAISVSGKYGRISVTRCGFYSHPGFPRDTADTAQAAPLTETSPFVGSPVYIYGSAANADYINATTTAYVSCVTDRAQRSSIDVSGCDFDQSRLGFAESDSSQYLGAFMAMHNGYTVRGVNAFSVCNLFFRNNTLQMGLRPGALSNFSNRTLFSWGFYVGAIGDGLPLSTNYSTTPPAAAVYAQTSVYDNIVCEGNHFDLGGAAETPGGLVSPLQTLWRSQQGSVLAAAGSRDTSCCFGVSLKNRTLSGTSNGKRGAHGVVFRGNHVSFRGTHQNDVSSTWFYANNELGLDDIHTYIVILECDDFTDSAPASVVPTVTAETYGSSYRVPLQAIVSPLIEGNFVEMMRVASPNPAAGEKSYAFLLSKVLQPRVVNNFVVGVTNDTSYGAYFYNCYGAIFTGNNFLGFGASAAYSNGANKNSSAANMLAYADGTNMRQAFTDGTDFDETL